MTRLRFLNRWVIFAVVAGAVALFMDQDYYYTSSTSSASTPC